MSKWEEVTEQINNDELHGDCNYSYVHDVNDITLDGMYSIDELEMIVKRIREAELNNE